VHTNLTYFEHITACNIKDVKVTSLQNEINNLKGNNNISMKDVEDIVVASFREIFGKETVEKTTQDLNKILTDNLQL